MINSIFVDCAWFQSQIPRACFFVLHFLGKNRVHGQSRTDARTIGQTHAKWRRPFKDPPILRRADEDAAIVVSFAVSNTTCFSPSWFANIVRVLVLTQHMFSVWGTQMCGVLIRSMVCFWGKKFGRPLFFFCKNALRKHRYASFEQKYVSS